MPGNPLPQYIPPYAMQQTGQTIEMSLREHLLAAGAGQPQPVQQHSPHQHSASPHHEHSIDPAIAGAAYATMDQDDPTSPHMGAEMRKGKRELSTSKRAAQNRAAQRAFRQRKEEYIKNLKDHVDELEARETAFRQLQTEHYLLRNYVLTLQTQLLDKAGSYPPPPAQIDLSRISEPAPPPPAIQSPHQNQSHAVSTAHQQQQALQASAAQQQGHQQQSVPAPGVQLPHGLPVGQAPTAAMSSSAVSQLQAAAAAAQATENSMHNGKHPNAEGYVPASAEYSPQNKVQKIDDSPPQEDNEVDMGTGEESGNTADES